MKKNGGIGIASLDHDFDRFCPGLIQSGVDVCALPPHSIIALDSLEPRLRS